VTRQLTPGQSTPGGQAAEPGLLAAEETGQLTARRSVAEYRTVATYLNALVQLAGTLPQRIPAAEMAWLLQGRREAAVRLGAADEQRMTALLAWLRDVAAAHQDGQGAAENTDVLGVSPAPLARSHPPRRPALLPTRPVGPVGQADD
jgi:aryl-alcohol dehydrogenase-like predicted oxidoreductase